MADNQYRKQYEQTSRKLGCQSEQLAENGNQSNAIRLLFSG
jgi:hypothetical protein